VRLVLDLAEVSFISSAGFGVLMSVIDDLRDQGGDLKMAAVAGDVFRIFELLEFHRVFEFYDTVDQALAAFE
jgi:anti-sigma B factor antagonist